MQKILSLVWFKIYPPHFGGQKGIALFNKYLAEYFDIDCLCSHNNELTTDAGCNVIPTLPVSKKQFIDPAAWMKIRKQLNSKNYNYIILEQPYYGLIVQWLIQNKTKLIVHTHNIESQRFRSLGKKSWRLLYYYEKWCLQKAHVVLFKNEQEKQTALANFGLEEKNCYVLPYGVEKPKHYAKEECRKKLSEKYGFSKDEKIILFAGTLDYAPNAQAVKSIYLTIEPLLRQQLNTFKILICGRNQFPAFAYLKELKNDNIIQTGFVKDIETYFGAADVLINPVQNIHGVQTKIFDALNFNLNIVCFDVAIKEMPSYLSQKLFVTDNGDFNSFTNNIINALNYNFATPGEFYNDFSWKNIIKKFVNYLQLNHPAP